MTEVRKRRAFLTPRLPSEPKPLTLTTAREVPEVQPPSSVETLAVPPLVRPELKAPREDVVSLAGQGISHKLIAKMTGRSQEGVREILANQQFSEQRLTGRRILENSVIHICHLLSGPGVQAAIDKGNLRAVIDLLVALGVLDSPAAKPQPAPLQITIGMRNIPGLPPLEETIKIE